MPAVVEAAVPNVVGLQAPVALNKLAKGGLTGTTRGVFSDKPKNEVVGQDPAATTKVKKDSTVTLDVSKGKKSIPVPDVVGQDTAAAIETVKAQGLEVKVVRVPSSEPAGQVVAQAPPSGQNAPGGSTVRLNVSGRTGGATTTASAPTTTAASAPKPEPKPTPAKPERVTVPDVRGLKLLAARKAIREAGLVTEFKRVPSNEPKGTVLGQSPKPGATKKTGDHVRVTVSLGPKPSVGAQPTVPDVTGEDEATARQDLEAAGFTATVVNQDTTDPAADGIVVDQNPQPGGEAPAKSHVTIYVSRYTGG
jgi:serine/threonine-protein kinase